MRESEASPKEGAPFGASFGTPFGRRSGAGFDPTGAAGVPCLPDAEALAAAEGGRGPQGLTGAAAHTSGDAGSDPVVVALEQVAVLLRSTPVGDLTRSAMIEQIAALEVIKNTVSARQGCLAVVFDVAERDVQEQAGVPVREQGRGVAEQIGLARHESPARAARFVNRSRILFFDLPETMGRHLAGEVSEYRAGLIATEVALLDAEGRAEVDRELNAFRDDPARADRKKSAGVDLGGMSDRAVRAAAAAAAYRADPSIIRRRGRHAESERYVSLRPAPDTMTILNAYLPVREGVACYAALKQAADSARAAGDPRSRGQVMADTLIARLTGAEQAGQLPVELQIVLTAEDLTADTDTRQQPAGADDLIADTDTRQQAAGADDLIADTDTRQQAAGADDLIADTDTQQQPADPDVATGGGADSAETAASAASDTDVSSADAVVSPMFDADDDADNSTEQSAQVPSMSSDPAAPETATPSDPATPETATPSDPATPESVAATRGTGGNAPAGSTRERTARLNPAGENTPGVEVRAGVGLIGGYGPVPAATVRDWLRESLDAGGKVWIRRLLTDPITKEATAIDSRARYFPLPVRRLILARDRYCRTPYCGAPIRHLDHASDYATGGTSTPDNGQGLCERCNQAKTAPGWTARAIPDPLGLGRHLIETTTPTGHTYRSTAPPALPGMPGTTGTLGTTGAPSAPSDRTDSPRAQAPRTG